MRLWTTITLLGLLAITTVGCAARGGTRVILSTDLATGLQNGWRKGVNDIDDGLAMGMALADTSLDVRGVVAMFGNNDMEPAKAVGDRVAQLARSDVRVLRGAAVKLSDPQVEWSDGTPLYRGCLNEGVELMASELRRGRLAVIAIGPLTDVACLIQNFPAEAANITEVVAIMGRRPHQSFAIGPVSGLTDFNFVMDVRAAQVVLESSVPVTFMTFSLTSSALVPAAALDPLRPKTSELARFVVGAAEPWITFWANTFKENGFHPWDQNAVHYVVRPSAFTCEPAGVQIVACPSAPYHKDDGNPCAGHGSAQPSSLDKESAQLWLSPAATSRVKMCTAYASETAKQEFLNAIFDFVR